MLTYEEMKYLTAFAECGTLLAVSKQFHISQPTITRAMKKAEEVFGVPLFDRTKNSIKLNENGSLAAAELKDILKRTDDALQKVRKFNKAGRTISIGSAAAVQLPRLVQFLTTTYQDKTISTELKMPDELLEGLDQGLFQLIILPYEPDASNYYFKKIEEEHLMFYLPKNHHFAREKSLSLPDMNGENMLLSDIGFWSDLIRTKMPDSRFLLQTERYSARREKDKICVPLRLLMTKALWAEGINIFFAAAPTWRGEDGFGGGKY